MAGEKFIRTMKKMSSESAKSSSMTDLVFGEVLAVSPLEIKIDSRFIVKEEFVLLSGLCQSKTITQTIIHRPGEIDEYTTELETELWRGLEVGDNLRMIRVAKGQLYYAIERGGAL